MEGAAKGLWDWLQEGLWWHDCLPGEQVECCPLCLDLLLLWGDRWHLGLLASLLPVPLWSPHQGVLHWCWVLLHLHKAV